MRLGAHSPPSRAPAPELRPQLGLFVALLGGLGALTGLLLLRSPDPVAVEAECRAIADVAPVLSSAPVIPELDLGDPWAMDCRKALVAAGVPIAAPATRLANGFLSLRVGVAFERPQMVAPDRMIVNYGVICGGLCGQGYRAELVRRNGRWEVVARSETWIS